MANLNVLNTQNSLPKDAPSDAYSFVLNGASVQILCNRDFFENDNRTLFPATAGGVFNSTNSSVSMNFQNGQISGADGFSSAFFPAVPAAGQARAATVYVDLDNKLHVIYGGSDTVSNCQNGILSGDATITGNIPLGIIRLFTVVLTSADGISLDDISDSLFYVFYNNLGVVKESKKVRYVDPNVSILQKNHRIEYFAASQHTGDTSFLTTKTMFQNGDSLSLIKTVGGTDVSVSVTVTGISYGTQDQVSFTPALPSDFTTDVVPRAVKYVISDLDSNMASFSDNPVYDSGWIAVAPGASGTLTHTVNKVLNGVPTVYFNQTAVDTNVKIIPNGFVSGVVQLGVWVSLESSGQNTVFYKCGGNGIYFDFESNSVVTTGFIRIIFRRL